MKSLLTLTLIFSSFICFGQKKTSISDGGPAKSVNSHNGYFSTLEKNLLSDTVFVKVNAVQFTILAEKEKKMNDAKQVLSEAEKDYGISLELLIGYKQEEIESIRFIDGQFKIILKPKKK